MKSILPILLPLLLAVTLTCDVAVSDEGIVCPNCEHVNPDGNKYCTQCGAALPRLQTYAGATARGRLLDVDDGWALLGMGQNEGINKGDQFCTLHRTDVILDPATNDTLDVIMRPDVIFTVQRVNASTTELSWKPRHGNARPTTGDALYPLDAFPEALHSRSVRVRISAGGTFTRPVREGRNYHDFEVRYSSYTGLTLGSGIAWSFTRTLALDVSVAYVTRGETLYDEWDGGPYHRGSRSHGALTLGHVVGGIALRATTGLTPIAPYTAFGVSYGIVTKGKVVMDTEMDDGEKYHDEYDIMENIADGNLMVDIAVGAKIAIAATPLLLEVKYAISTNNMYPESSEDSKYETVIAGVTLLL